MTTTPRLIVCLLIALACLSAADLPTIKLPPGTRYVDATQPPYGAVGDGQTDCTDALQRALLEARYVYLPAGTYLVSDTLWWGEQESEAKRRIIQGEHRDRVTIRLVDRAAKFQDPGQPREVIRMASKQDLAGPANAFRNCLFDLTVDVGQGNPGAIAVFFYAHNQGAMERCRLLASPGSGLVGLDLYRGLTGPCLVQDLLVEGFQYGIRAGGSVREIVLDRISLRGQGVCGIYNDNNILPIADLDSVNSVPAVRTVADWGFVTIVGADLRGGDPTRPAIENVNGHVLVRHARSTGYRTTLSDRGTDIAGPITWHATGGSRSLFTPPADIPWLPIERAPSVPWDPAEAWVVVRAEDGTPTTYLDGKGKPRPIVDYSDAIQKAIDSGATTVVLPTPINPRTGKPENVWIQKTVVLRGKVRRLTGLEAAVEGRPADPSQPMFRIADGDAPAVVFERMAWGYAAQSGLEIATSRTVVVRNCIIANGLRMHGGGKVFVEDVCGGPFDIGAGTKVWARQLNPECESTKVANHGGMLWILGMKTEREHINLLTDAGGRSELMGGMVYGNSGRKLTPCFVVTDGQMVASVAANCHNGWPYEIAVEETRTGTTRSFTRTDLPQRDGWGFALPLFVSGVDAGGSPSAPAPPTISTLGRPVFYSVTEGNRAGQLTGRWSLHRNLVVGEMFLANRQYLIEALPAWLEGADTIRANTDVYSGALPGSDAGEVPVHADGSLAIVASLPSPTALLPPPWVLMPGVIRIVVDYNGKDAADPKASPIKRSEERVFARRVVAGERVRFPTGTKLLAFLPRVLPEVESAVATTAIPSASLPPSNRSIVAPIAPAPPPAPVVADAGWIDLSKPPYHAVGDGRTDIGPLLQRALAEHQVVYLPEGDWLIGDGLWWSYKENGSARRVLQGAGRDRTRLRLADARPAYAIAGKPRDVLRVQGISPSNTGIFRYAMHDLTLSIGSGNAGAVAIGIAANNTLSLERVHLHAEDGSGLWAIDFSRGGHASDLGLIDSAVSGFAGGIRAEGANRLVVLDAVAFTGQRGPAVSNLGNALAARDVSTRGSAPAIVNSGPWTHTVLFDADLTAQVGTAAVSNRGGAAWLARVATTGGGSAFADAGAITPAQQLSEFVTASAYHRGAGPAAPASLPALPPVPSADAWVRIGFANGTATTFITLRRKVEERTVSLSTAVQEAIDGGAEAIVLLPPPQGEACLEFTKTVELRGKLRWLLGCERVIASPGMDGSQPLLRVADGDGPIVVEGLELKAGSRAGIEVATTRQVFLRRITGSDVIVRTGAPVLDQVQGGALQVLAGAVNARWLAPVAPKSVLLDIAAEARLSVFALRAHADARLLNLAAGGQAAITGGLISGKLGRTPAAVALADPADLTLSLACNQLAGGTLEAIAEMTVRKGRRWSTGALRRRNDLGWSLPLWRGVTVDAADPPAWPASTLISEARAGGADAAVTAVSPGFGIGDMLVIDRPYPAVDVPDALRGGELVRTNVEIGKLLPVGAPALTLRMAADAMLWAAWPSDGPASQRKPGEGWALTDQRLGWVYDPAASAGGNPLSWSEIRKQDVLWRRTVAAGTTVVLPAGVRCVVATPR